VKNRESKTAENEAGMKIKRLYRLMHSGRALCGHDDYLSVGFIHPAGFVSVVSSNSPTLKSTISKVGELFIKPRTLASSSRSEFRTFAFGPVSTLMFGFWNMSNPRNITGPQIRKLRSQQGLTQPMLAARCRRWGWDLSRETLAKIETQLRWVSDFEMLCLAKALRVMPEDLWPPKDRTPKILEDFFKRLSAEID
jgi:hypothetical protein